MDIEASSAKVSSFIISGCKAVPVTVRATIEPGGLPTIRIEGVREMNMVSLRGLIRSALKSAGYEVPRTAVHVEVTPGIGRHLPPGIDLPIAAAILTASNQIPSASIEGRVLVGELAIDGAILPSRGLHLFQREVGGDASLLTSSMVDGKTLPHDLGGRGVLGIGNLSALRQGPEGQMKMKAAAIVDQDLDLEEVQIDEKMARAIEVACAGRHNLLLIGSDSKLVKSVAAHVAACLPWPTASERAEMAAMESIAGDPRASAPVGPRPCVTWDAGSDSLPDLMGGGRPVMPGAVSRASGGALVIENMSMMSEAAAMMLADAIRNDSVHIVRAEGAFVMPSTAMVVGCIEDGGSLPDPLRDSPFICVEVKEREDADRIVTSSEIRQRVVDARAFAKDSAGRREALSKHPEDLVARTIADLDGSELVDVGHQREAHELTKAATGSLFIARIPAYAPECALDELASCKAAESAAFESHPEETIRKDTTR